MAFPLDIQLSSTVGGPYIQNPQLSKCYLQTFCFLFPPFLPLHLLFNIKTLSVVVYPPSACPPLAKALISHTLSILHDRSHSLSYTLYPHLLKDLSHTQQHTCKRQTLGLTHIHTLTHTILLNPIGGPCCRWTYTPFLLACERGN